MQCPSCHAKQSSNDSYCHKCGADLTSTSTSIVPAQSSLPALFQNPTVSKNVAAGVGAIAVGVGFELLRRNLLSRLVSNRTIDRALPATRGIKDILFPNQNKYARPAKGYEIQETIISVQRVIRRV